jgi:hypothetical protein
MPVVAGLVTLIGDSLVTWFGASLVTWLGASLVTWIGCHCNLLRIGDMTLGYLLTRYVNQQAQCVYMPSSEALLDASTISG